MTEYASPFSSRPQQNLHWANLNCHVPSKNGEKQILRNVSGSVPEGKICCILGPSGSGKTSLLNVLAGRVAPSGKFSISGQVTVNNEVIVPYRFKSNIAYVMQEDALWPTLTCREHLLFSAQMRIPSSVSTEVKLKLVETMIEELSLQKCADTVTGDKIIRGVSGGEKKRTAIGVELVTNPSLVFLDEPTSGLDSFSALRCVELLRKISVAGSAVLCTIHQPSSEVFNKFDSCIILKSGNVVYQGPVKGLLPHFASFGFPAPPNFNPADHVMNVVQRNDFSALEAAKLPTPPQELKVLDSTKASFAKGSVKVSLPTAASSFMTQLKWLCWREVISLKRDPRPLKGRFLLTAFLYILFGLIFKDAGGRDDSIPQNLNSHFGAITMVSIVAMFGTAQTTLLLFPTERPIFLREYSTGTYSSLSYFVSKVCQELPLAFLQLLFAVTIIYWLMDLDSDFFSLVFALWLLGSASTSVAVFISSIATDAQKATEAAPLLFVPQILFSGFFVRIEQIPSWIRWPQWLCSLKYSLNLTLLLEFGDCPEGSKEACDRLLDQNETKKDLIWLYILVLVVLFVVVRTLSLVVLTIKAQTVY